MPKITINEIDLTNPGLVNESSNLVYVPGLAKRLPKDFNINKTRIYTSLKTFQYDFGDKVPTIGLGSDVANHPGFDDGKAYDSGYIYATELLRLGVPVLYSCVNNASGTYEDREGNTLASKPTDDRTEYWIKPLDDAMYMRADFTAAVNTQLGDTSGILSDKGLYNIKFISNGGYEELNAKIYALAVERQDCVALLDIKYTSTVKSLIPSDSDGVNLANLKTSLDLSSYDSVNGKYAAVFAPWGVYAPTSIQNYIKEKPTDAAYTYYPKTVELPGSFGYLIALATALKNGANNWVAMAGATRGQIPFLVDLKEELTQADIDKLQSRSSVSVNPIATINPFGRIVWGNRTLYNNILKGNLTASSFLNIRNLCSDVKKQVWQTARRMTFEQNSDILWVNFKSYITPVLDQMVTSGCLSGYELRKQVAKQKAELRCAIRLYPIEAVEDFEIDIELADESTAIVE